MFYPAHKDIILLHIPKINIKTGSKHASTNYLPVGLTRNCYICLVSLERVHDNKYTDSIIASIPIGLQGT